MTPFASRRLHTIALAAEFGLALVAAPAAHAFTIDNQSNTNSDGSAKYADPDSRFSGNGNGMTTYRQGNMTLQFGTRRPNGDERYNTDRMFNPLGRPGEPDSR